MSIIFLFTCLIAISEEESQARRCILNGLKTVQSLEERFKIVRNFETDGKSFPEVQPQTVLYFGSSAFSSSRKLYLCHAAYFDIYGASNLPARAKIQTPLTDPVPVIVRALHNIGTLGYRLSLINDLEEKEGIHPTIAKDRLLYLVEAAELGFSPSILALQALPLTDKTYLLDSRHLTTASKDRLRAILQIETEDFS